jgi:hypothetical protein
LCNEREIILDVAEVDGSVWYPVSRRWLSVDCPRQSTINAYLNRGLTWEDGFSKLPNGMDGLTWSSVLKPFAAVIHDAAIAANPNLATIFEQSSKKGKYQKTKIRTAST